MLNLNDALNLIIKGIEATTDKIGLKLQYPDGVRPPELPIKEENKKSVLMYTGDKGRLRIEYADNKLALYTADADESDTPDDDMQRASLNLLVLEEYEERDLKYIIEEYNETIEKKFIGNTGKHSKKLPQPVSRSKAKNGTLSYDANTLGDRFTKLFPELRDEYKNNIELYDEFLAEDFFVNHGNKYVLDTIQRNDPTRMRKLFNLFNDIYEDGTNDTQSLVAVTILGDVLSENLDLVDRCESYFSDTMRQPVTEIIRYLSKSNSAKMRLKNPPVYKPEKQKKKGLMSSMLGM